MKYKEWARQKPAFSRREDFSSCQEVWVLRGHEGLNAEVTETLRALCVKARKAQRTRGVSFGVAAGQRR